MKKTENLMGGAIPMVKHGFQQAEPRPNKCQKHRYERRKVRQYIRLADWEEEAEDEKVINALQTLGMRLT